MPFPLPSSVPASILVDTAGAVVNVEVSAPPPPGLVLTLTPVSDLADVAFAPPTIDYAGATTLQSFAVTASNSGVANITFEVSGTASAFYSTVGTGATLAALHWVTAVDLGSDEVLTDYASEPVVVTLSGAPRAGTSLVVTPTLGAGTGDLVFTPPSYTLDDPSDSTDLSFVMVGGATTGPIRVDLVATGSAAPAFDLSLGGLDLTTYSSFAVADLPATIAPGTTTDPVTLTLTALPGAGTSLSVTPLAVGTGGLTFDPAVVVFDDATSVATFTATPTTLNGTVEISFGLGGSGAGPFRSTFAATARIGSFAVADTLPEVVLSGSDDAEITVSLTNQLPDGLSLTLTPTASGPGDLTFSPPSLTFDGFLTEATIALVGGSTPGAVNVTWAKSGSAAPAFDVADLAWSTRVAHEVVLGGLGAFLEYGSTVEVLVSLGGPVPAGQSLTVSLSTSDGGAVVGLDPTDLVFPAGTDEVMLEVTVGETVADLTLFTVLAGDGGVVDLFWGLEEFDLMVRKFVRPPQGAPSWMLPLEDSDAITLVLSHAPRLGGSLELTPVATGSAGLDVVFTPATVAFGPGETEASLVAAANAVGGTVNVSLAVTGGADAADYYAPPSTAAFAFPVYYQTETIAAVNGRPLTLAREAVSDPITVVLTGGPLPGRTLVLNPLQSGQGNVVFEGFPLEFTAGETEKSFTVVGGALPGDVAIRFDASGSAALQYDVESYSSNLVTVISGASLATDPPVESTGPPIVPIILASVFGCLLIVAIVAALLLWKRKKDRKRKEAEAEAEAARLAAAKQPVSVSGVVLEEADGKAKAKAKGKRRRKRGSGSGSSGSSSASGSGSGSSSGGGGGGGGKTKRVRRRVGGGGGGGGSGSGSSSTDASRMFESVTLSSGDMSSSELRARRAISKQNEKTLATGAKEEKVRFCVCVCLL